MFELCVTWYLFHIWHNIQLAIKLATHPEPVVVANSTCTNSWNAQYLNLQWYTIIDASQKQVAARINMLFELAQPGETHFVVSTRQTLIYWSRSLHISYHRMSLSNVDIRRTKHVSFDGFPIKSQREKVCYQIFEFWVAWYIFQHMIWDN